MRTGTPSRRRPGIRRLLSPLMVGGGLAVLGVAALVAHAQRQGLVDEYANAPVCAAGAIPTETCAYEGPVPAEAVSAGESGASRDLVDVHLGVEDDPVHLVGAAADGVWDELRRNPVAVVRMYRGVVVSVTAGADTAATSDAPQPPSPRELPEGVAFLAAGLAVLAVGVPTAMRRRPGGSHVDGVDFEPARRRRLGDATRAALNGAMFWTLGGWAAALTVAGQPVLGPLSALVLFELGLAAFRVGRITGGVVDDPATSGRVAAILNEVCARAGCPPPAVALRDDAIRAAAVRAAQGRTVLLLSRPFAQRVDDAELRGILAHEVVHVLRRDTAAARVRAVVAMVAGGVVATAVVIAAGAVDITDLPIWSAAWTLGFMLALAVVSRTNRRLETRADLEAARLTGDPDALARALQVAAQVAEEVRTALHGNPPLRWVLAPLSWRLPSHPPVAQRTAALRGLAAAAAAPAADTLRGGPLAGG